MEIDERKFVRWRIVDGQKAGLSEDATPFEALAAGIPFKFYLKSFHSGDRFYVLSLTWLRQWQAFAARCKAKYDTYVPSPEDGVDPELMEYHPGRINNLHLVQYTEPPSLQRMCLDIVYYYELEKVAGEIPYGLSEMIRDRLENWNRNTKSEVLLRHNIREGVDFQLVTEGTWLKLVHMFGGGPAIKRSVIRTGNEAQVVLYPVSVWLTEMSGGSYLWKFADSSTLNDVRKRVALRTYSPPHRILLFEEIKTKEGTAQVKVREWEMSLKELGYSDRVEARFVVHFEGTSST